MISVNAQKAEALQRKASIATVQQALFAVLTSALQEAGPASTPQLRAQIYQLQAAIDKAIEQGDLEVIALLIGSAEIPAEFEPYRQAMLSTLP